MNPNSCNGTVKSDLCPGGVDNKCCIPKPSNTTNKPNNNNNNYTNIIIKRQNHYFLNLHEILNICFIYLIYIIIKYLILK